MRGCKAQCCRRCLLVSVSGIFRLATVSQASNCPRHHFSWSRDTGPGDLSSTARPCTGSSCRGATSCAPRDVVGSDLSARNQSGLGPTLGRLPIDDSKCRPRKRHRDHVLADFKFEAIVNRSHVGPAGANGAKRRSARRLPFRSRRVASGGTACSASPGEGSRRCQYGSSASEERRRTRLNARHRCREP